MSDALPAGRAFFSTLRYFLYPRDNRRRVKTVMLTQPSAIGGRRILAIRDPQALQGNPRARFRQHFGDQAPQPAVNVMLFDGND